MTDLRPCKMCLSKQSSNYLNHYTLFFKKNLITFVHLRYYLGGHRPSETTTHSMYLKKLAQKI